jgi:ketosteroid isomerase-like protein
MQPAEVVRALFDRMQARDWSGAEACMAPDATIRYIATGEQFTGVGFMAMNRAYPEGWNLEVQDLLAVGPRVGVQVRVPNGGQVDWLTAFYTVDGDQIIDGTEHWLTEHSEPAPEWRRPFTVEPPAH